MYTKFKYKVPYIEHYIDSLYIIYCSICIFETPQKQNEVFHICKIFFNIFHKYFNDIKNEYAV